MNIEVVSGINQARLPIEDKLFTGTTSWLYSGIRTANETGSDSLSTTVRAASEPEVERPQPKPGGKSGAPKPEKDAPTPQPAADGIEAEEPEVERPRPPRKKR